MKRIIGIGVAIFFSMGAFASNQFDELELRVGLKDVAYGLEVSHFLITNDPQSFFMFRVEVEATKGSDVNGGLCPESSGSIDLYSGIIQPSGQVYGIQSASDLNGAMMARGMQRVASGIMVQNESQKLLLTPTGGPVVVNFPATAPIGMYQVFFIAACHNQNLSEMGRFVATDTKMFFFKDVSALFK